MDLPELHEGVLRRRYKRFLADIETKAGALTAHCPNTGAMTGCAEPGWSVWYSLSDNPKRKYAATWEIVDTEQGHCSVNTGRANHLVKEAIEDGVIQELSGQTIRTEAPIPDGSGRFDLLVDDAYVEVKSVTLRREDGVGEFPDAVSARALKHVRALEAVVAEGYRGVLIFCAQHTGINAVRPALSIDPAYAQGLTDAIGNGVEVYAYGITLDLEARPARIRIDRALPFSLLN